MHGSIPTIMAFGLSAALAAPALAGGAGGPSNIFRTTLSGFEEVPAVSTDASGRFRITVSGGRADYRLAYDGIESPVRFAHIHFGQQFTNGGVIVFLCNNVRDDDDDDDVDDDDDDDMSVPAGVPACPEEGGEVRGTLTAADVIGPSNQGVGPGEFREFLRAMRRGAAYVNVHSDDFPGGEIRGQIERLPRRPAAR